MGHGGLLGTAATRSQYRSGAEGLERDEAVAGKQVICFYRAVAGLAELGDEFIFGGGDRALYSLTAR